MTILEHPDAQTLLDDADAFRRTSRAAGRTHRAFPGALLPASSNARSSAATLADPSRANSPPCRARPAEPIAHLFGVRRENLQDFVGSSPWDDRRHPRRDPPPRHGGSGRPRRRPHRRRLRLRQEGRTLLRRQTPVVRPTGQGRELPARHLPRLRLPPRPHPARSPPVPASGVGRRPRPPPGGRRARRRRL